MHLLMLVAEIQIYIQSDVQWYKYFGPRLSEVSHRTNI